MRPYEGFVGRGIDFNRLTTFICALRRTKLLSKKYPRWCLGPNRSLLRMYCFYYQSFLYLSVPEVLLFTIFTPIYVTLIYDLLHRQFSAWYLLTAAIAVLGAAVIKFEGINENFVIGFFIVQWSMGIALKYLIISTTSFVAIIAIYELLVRRINVLRFLFGMRLAGRLTRADGGVQK